MEEIEKISETHEDGVEVLYKNNSRTLIELEVVPKSITPLHITIAFDNRTSSYPTSVVIKDRKEMKTIYDLKNLESDLLEMNIVVILSNLISDVNSYNTYGDNNMDMDVDDDDDLLQSVHDNNGGYSRQSVHNDHNDEL
jgi:hypothetical protein